MCSGLGDIQRLLEPRTGGLSGADDHSDPPIVAVSSPIQAAGASGHLPVTPAPPEVTADAQSLSAQTAGCSDCWLLSLLAAHTTGCPRCCCCCCCCLLFTLLVAAGCSHCWLLSLLAAHTDGRCWLSSLLAALAAGCLHYWLFTLLAAAADCSHLRCSLNSPGTSHVDLVLFVNRYEITRFDMKLIEVTRVKDSAFSNLLGLGELEKNHDCQAKL
jgi:hypothetical protein